MTPGRHRLDSTRLLRALEWGGRLLRRLGLGALVDRAAPSLGPAVARTTVEVRGFRLTGNHVGHLYYLRELAEGDRDRLLVEIARACTPPGAAAVDVGAYIGYVTLELARAVGETGRVWAFEPDPRSQEALRANVARNGLAGRVTLIAKALGSEPGEAVLHLSGGGEASSLVDQGTTSDRVAVEVVTLDDELPDLVPALVKLDLEGLELAALRGMEGALARAGDGVTLLVECNPGALARAGTSAGDLLDWLGGAGFRTWTLSEADARLLPTSASLGDAEYVNLVCTRPGGCERLRPFLRTE